MIDGGAGNRAEADKERHCPAGEGGPAAPAHHQVVLNEGNARQYIQRGLSAHLPHGLDRLLAQFAEGDDSSAEDKPGQCGKAHYHGQKSYG